MPRDIPSLNAIRVFECAARKLNFTRAADELFITQSAVSRQIKLLEEELGVDLFRRHGPKLELTEEGAKYAAVLREALALIRRGTIELRRRAGRSALTISLLPSFASKWLVPRMIRFQEKYQDMALTLSASYGMVDFELEPEIDAAIRFGPGGYDDLYSECLINEQTFPVCSPDLIPPEDLPLAPEALLNYPIFHGNPNYDEWDRWFHSLGVDYSRDGKSADFTDALMLLSAALDGQGIVMSRSLLVSDELRHGVLIKPHNHSIASKNSYYFVCPRGREEKPELKAFLDWIRDEARASDSYCAGNA